MTFTLPDGAVIEVTVSDQHTGPGRQYGQRCGSAVWWRQPGESWVISKHRHLYKIMEWIELSESFADFIEGEMA